MHTEWLSDSGGKACSLDAVYPINLSALVTFDRFLSVTVLNPIYYNVFCPLMLKAHKGMYSRLCFLSFLTPQLGKEQIFSQCVWEELILKAG